MKHQKSLPKTSKYFTPALVFGLNVQVSGVKMGCFHKVLPNVKSVYVTLQNFTPDLQKIYTDISVISVTLCNSGASPSVIPNNPPNNPLAVSRIKAGSRNFHPK